jgi:hypothetical protein
MEPTQTPKQDYLKITRDFITGLQTHLRQFEDQPDLLDEKIGREILQAAYRTQSSMIQQHFSVISILYDREFVNKATSTIDPTKKSSVIIP